MARVTAGRWLRIVVLLGSWASLPALGQLPAGSVSLGRVLGGGGPQAEAGSALRGAFRERQVQSRANSASPAQPPTSPFPPSDQQQVQAQGDYPQGGAYRDQSLAVELCECEKATGTADGLSCEKEGYFVSSFERVGSWLSGGGYVPLSHAICCRPCVPTELPVTGAALSPDDKAVAIVSLGCHTATGTGPAPLTCEGNGNSLVAGWAESVRVSSSIDAYYPLGAAACCTPSLLLTSGSAWELERCDCQLSEDINCGGLATHRLLYGYTHWRGPVRSLGRDGYVPVGPALCCRTCLSDRVHPISDCADLNFCSGRGVCTLGSCQCLDGFAGSDCGERENDQSNDGLPQWLLSVIIVSNFGLFSLCIVFINRLISLCRTQNAAEEGGSEQGEHLREPLMGGFDDIDGSVGSADTTECDSDEEHPHVADDLEAEEAVLEEARPAVEHGAEGGVGDTGPLQGSGGSVAMTARVHPLGDSTTDGRDALQEDRVALATALEDLERGPPVERVEPGLLQSLGERWRRRRQRHVHTARDPVAAVGGGELVEPPQHPEIESAEALPAQRVRKAVASGEEAKARVHSGVQGVECSVCMLRPVQVALVPCGHTCMCRRCSRRLLRCPICRRDIARRQRLFIGG